MCTTAAGGVVQDTVEGLGKMLRVPITTWFDFLFDLRF